MTTTAYASMAAITPRMLLYRWKRSNAKKMSASAMRLRESTRARRGRADEEVVDEPVQVVLGLDGGNVDGAVREESRHGAEQAKNDPDSEGIHRMR